MTKKLFICFILLILIKNPLFASPDEFCDIAEDVTKKAKTAFIENKEQGLKLFIKAHNLCNLPEINYNLGIAYYLFGSLSEAEKYIRIAVNKADVQNSIWLNNLAYIILENKSDPKYALKLAQNAVKLNDKLVSVYDTLAAAQFVNGRELFALTSIKKASEKWNKSDQLKQSHEKIVSQYIKKGLKYIIDGNITQGLDTLKQGNFEYNIARVQCRTLAKLGKMDEAVTTTQVIIKNFPDKSQENKLLYDDVMDTIIQTFYVSFQNGNNRVAMRQAKFFSEKYPELKKAKKAYDELFDAYTADTVNVKIPKIKRSKRTKDVEKNQLDREIETLFDSLKVKKSK